MKLESALKQFYPKSPMITDTPNCTDPNRMKGMDTAGALGMTEQRAKFGMSAFFAKNDVSEKDKFSTVEQLTQYALKVTPKLVAKSAGSKLGHCLVILAKMSLSTKGKQVLMELLLLSLGVKKKKLVNYAKSAMEKEG